MEQLQRIFPVQYALVAIAVGSACAFVVYRRRRRGGVDVGTSGVEAVVWGGFVFGAVVTASVTLLNYTRGATGSGFVDLTLESPSPAQTVVNLVLFWWIALLLPLVRQIGVTATTAVTFAASVVTEVLQWVLPTGRSAALMDVVLNTAGGFVLALIAVFVVRPALTRGRPRGARGAA